MLSGVRPGKPLGVLLAVAALALALGAGTTWFSYLSIVEDLQERLDMATESLENTSSQLSRRRAEIAELNDLLTDSQSSLLAVRKELDQEQQMLEVKNRELGKLKTPLSSDQEESSQTVADGNSLIPKNTDDDSNEKSRSRYIVPVREGKIDDLLAEIEDLKSTIEEMKRLAPEYSSAP